MKVAVIGKGTSAIITICNLIKNGHEVDVFYDENTPHISVGESTTPIIAGTLGDSLGISISCLLDEEVASLKTGVNFIGWGNNESFTHYFFNEIAFHFETGKFNPFINGLLEKRGVKYFAEKVNSLTFDNSGAILNQKKYDFVVNCSGWSNDLEYKKLSFETVNSAILYSKDRIVEHNKTLHEATEDGWQFGIPFPERGITKHGYLFNDKISNIEKVKEKFQGVEYKIIQWKPRYSKEFIHNPFYASNGNRLFFMEPLQALSLHYYNHYSNKICEYIKDPKRYYSAINHYNTTYNYEMFDYQASIAWHYSYGSKYKTDFWQDVTKRANNFLESNPKTQGDILERCFYNDITYGESTLSLGSFKKDDYLQIDSGMRNLGNSYLRFI